MVDLVNVWMAIVLTGTAIFASLAWREARKTRKDYNVFELIRYLQSEDMRLARRILIVDIGETGGSYSNWIKIPKLRDAAEQVCAAYDMVGIMLKRGLIDEDLVDEWQDSITKCYNAAKPMIDEYRGRSGPSYYKHFKYLYGVVNANRDNKDINNEKRVEIKNFLNKIDKNKIILITTTIVIIILVTSCYYAVRTSAIDSILDPIDVNKITIISTTIVIITLVTSCYYAVRTSAIDSMHHSRQNIETYKIYANSSKDDDTEMLYNKIAKGWEKKEDYFKGLLKSNTVSLNYCFFSIIFMVIALFFALVLANYKWCTLIPSIIAGVLLFLAIIIHKESICKHKHLTCVCNFDLFYRLFGLLSLDVISEMGMEKDGKSEDEEVKMPIKF